MGRSGTLDVLKLKVITLSHGKGGTVINASMVNQELAQLRKKWEDLSKDTQMRYVQEREMKIVEEKEVRVNNVFFTFRLSNLETACSERQDVINILSRCEDWLKRAGEHAAALKPVTADISRIRHLIEEHKVTKLTCQILENTAKRLSWCLFSD